MGARSKGRGDLATMIGWNAESFARTKRMKPLPKYLEAAKPKNAESGARDVQRLFERLIAKQGDGNGTPG